MREDMLGTDPESGSGIEALREAFSPYVQSDMVAALGGLQVHPANHRHTLRLELAALAASATKQDGDRKPRAEEIERMLRVHLPLAGECGQMQDPPEGLFTESISFFGGNYVVYPGDIDHASSILQAHLDSMFRSGSHAVEELRRNVTLPILALLVLSNEVARRLGHTRYMDDTEAWTRDIVIPPEKALAQLRRAVRFAHAELEALLERHKLDPSHLSPFVTQGGELDIRGANPYRNPLFLTPVVQMADTLVLALPGSVMLAIRHLIWVVACRMGARAKMEAAYCDFQWLKTKEHLRLMMYSEVRLDLPDWKRPPPVREGVFRIDTDKLAHVILVTDDAVNYNESDPFAAGDLSHLINPVDARRDALIEDLADKLGEKCQEVFAVTVVGGIGRFTGFGSNHQTKASRELFVSAPDLELFAGLRECDPLALWKFAGALDNQQTGTTIGYLAVADAFAVYRKHHHSFYLSDDRHPDYVSVLPEYRRPLRVKVAQMADIHSVDWKTLDNPQKVCRLHDDGKTPIYVPLYGLRRSPLRLVEEYAQPIWIYPSEGQKEAPYEMMDVYLPMSDLLAYWTWQLTPGLRVHLEPLGPRPVHVVFAFEDPLAWLELNPARPSEEHPPSIPTESRERRIKLALPKQLQTCFNRPDNSGDRIVVGAVMKALGDVLAAAGHTNTLDHATRSHLLDRYAPLGIKRMFSVLHGGQDAAIDQRGLVPTRNVQEHDYQHCFDGLVAELGARAPREGPVEDKKRSSQLCNDVVDVQLKRLRAKLSVFAWRPLLERLIANNEAIQHWRFVTKSTLPARVACFGGASIQAAKVADERNSTNQTALATRILIEIVAAEPPSGEKEVSIDDFDQLLALASHLFYWGSLSDMIHFEVTNIRLSVLPSGRIGRRDDKAHEGFVSMFPEAKVLESIQSEIDSYPDRFEPPVQPGPIESVPREYRNAFKAEFGVTAQQYREGCTLLMETGLESEQRAPSMRLAELKNVMNKKLAWGRGDFDRFLVEFSLKPRDRWESVPEGFERRDIYPWLYKRRLSYMLKPIIIGPGTNPTVFWGPRQIQESGRYLIGLVAQGRFEGSTAEMGTYKAKRNDETGSEFLREVQRWLEAHTNWRVVPRVPIRPGEPLAASDDLGDVDLLVIDETEGRVFSIECKSVSYGRNPREIVQELTHLLGREKRDGWVRKHQERNAWLNSNVNAVVSTFRLTFDPGRIHSLFLTSVEIPTTFIREMPLPFLSFTRLKREGAELLDSVVSQ